MHLKESFIVGIKELYSNKTRAALTMLGILFGVAAVIAMVSIGEGAREETLRQIELLGTNNIIINKRIPSESEKGSNVNYSPGLSLNDAYAINDINPFVESVTPVRERISQVSYKSTITDFSVIGTSSDYPQTFNSYMQEGTFFKEFHNNARSNVCVIGSGVKKHFFPFSDPVGEKLKIEELWFEIIGVVARKDVSSTGQETYEIRNFNNDIYIPIATMMYKMDILSDDQLRQMNNRRRWNDDNAQRMVDKNSVDQLTVKVTDSENIKEAAHLIKRILERKHFGMPDYVMILPEQLLAQKQKTQRIFNVVMGAIAGISLLVGGIGIMNIMLANILERTREIGIRRAVGATRNDILSQFLFEAVIISVTGGLLGIALGFILTQLISSYAGWHTVLSLYAILFAFLVSVATGVLFGIYPAKKAAEKNPIESLRYE